MAESDPSQTARGAGIGLVLGAGIAGVVAVVLATNLATTLGYGVGTGLVVGALTGTLAVANRGEQQYAVRLLGGGAVLGALGGAGVGTVGAWAIDAAPVSGLLVGVGAGFVHGLLVGGVLLAAARRQ